MRILLITFYYKPLNNIAVTRLAAFKKYLTEFGHQVDVLTRHYSENDIQTSNLSKGMLPGNDFEGDYYKKDKVIYTKYATQNCKLNISNKLPKGIKGLYNLSQLDVFHYSFVEYGFKAYKQEFSNEPHDVIIASSPAPATLLLANKIANGYKIPWIADFRDSYIEGTEKGLTKILKKYSLNKVLKSTNGIVFVSEGMKVQNLKFFNSQNKSIPTEIIYNGFSEGDSKVEISVLNKIKQLKNKYSKLLVYTGSIYPQRNLHFFLKALKVNELKTIGLVLVGVQEVFKNEILAKYNDLNVYFFDKVTYSTSIEIQKQADFLLLTIWKNNYTGFSGKVFEYLHSNKKIILDFDPPNDLKVYLEKFNNIYYCNDSFDKFDEILKIDDVDDEKNVVNRESISRKYQVGKLETFLKNNI